ncbi:hypothetical protein TRICI_004492 [Trichomonascus ciferrii]|uniref:Uncharacterized protein n=1 Tax=Trichomonascus ciferrii TaxID=44093 RepID=A0A642V0T0_9ASCO|nr:hypothetical protein TRICI_004492 [Trichomonascus ciferrii]
MTASRVLKDFNENELRAAHIKTDEFYAYGNDGPSIVRIVHNEKNSGDLPPLAPRIEIHVGQRKLLDFPALYRDLASVMPDALESQRPYILNVDSHTQQLHFIYAAYEEVQWVCHQLKIDYFSSDEYNAAIGVLCGHCIIEGDVFTDMESLGFANYNLDLSFLDNNATLSDSFNPLLFDYSSSAQPRSFPAQHNYSDPTIFSQNSANLKTQIQTLCEQQEFLEFIENLDKVWKEISDGV